MSDLIQMYRYDLTTGGIEGRVESFHMLDHSDLGEFLWRDGWRWRGAVFQSRQYVNEIKSIEMVDGTLEVHWKDLNPESGVQDLRNSLPLFNLIIGPVPFYIKTVWSPVTTTSMNPSCSKHDWIDTGMIRQYCRNCPAIGENKLGHITLLKLETKS